MIIIDLPFVTIIAADIMSYIVSRMNTSMRYVRRCLLGCGMHKRACGGWCCSHECSIFWCIQISERTIEELSDKHKNISEVHLGGWASGSGQELRDWLGWYSGRGGKVGS